MVAEATAELYSFFNCSSNMFLRFVAKAEQVVTPTSDFISEAETLLTIGAFSGIEIEHVHPLMTSSLHETNITLIAMATIALTKNTFFFILFDV